MADTNGTFTITNITLTRGKDLSSATLNDAANVIGTLIYDVQEGIYNGADWALTGSGTDKTFDADSTSLNEQFDVASTVVSDNGRKAFWLFGYTPTNYTLTYAMDCTSVSLNTLADLLATAIITLRIPSINLCTVQFVVKAADTAVPGAVCKARLKSVNQAGPSTILSNQEESDITDANGEAELDLVQIGSVVKGSGIYRIDVEYDGQPLANTETAIPNQSSTRFEVLV